MQETFRIRRADAGDADGLSRLAAATFPLACPPTTPAQDIAHHIAAELNAERFLEYMAAPDTEFHVAEDGSGLIGYLMLVAGALGAPPLPGRAPMEVRRIYVDPQWHGRAVAQALMATAAQRAAASGCDCLWLGTNQANDRAIAFYRSAGFSTFGTRTFQVGCSIECDYVLARGLRAAG